MYQNSSKGDDDSKDDINNDEDTEVLGKESTSPKYESQTATEIKPKYLFILREEGLLKAELDTILNNIF